MLIFFKSIFSQHPIIIEISAVFGYFVDRSAGRGDYFLEFEKTFYELIRSGAKSFLAIDSRKAARVNRGKENVAGLFEYALQRLFGASRGIFERAFQGAVLLIGSRIDVYGNGFGERAVL